MPGLLTVEEALRLVVSHAAEGGVETVPLAAAPGRVLAEEVRSDQDHPAFARSKVDGYAVRSADVPVGAVLLRVVCEVSAGKAPGDRIGPGECARIFTGAAVPEGADRVAKQEDCETTGPIDAVRVRIAARSLSEDFVVPRGAECRAGAVVASRGERVTAAVAGALASVGASRVPVFRRPRVRIVATGSELCPVDEVPGPGRIRNSNAPALAAAVASCGADVVSSVTTRDDDAEIQAALGAALDADVVLATGGVSVGDYDLVPPALARLKVRRVLHGVSLQPGKPLWFGTKGSTLVFGLPGNPVSALVNTVLFVRPALAKMQGLGTGPAPFLVRLGGPLPAGTKRRRYVPALASRDGPVVVATPIPFQGSGDVFGFARADLLLAIPEGAAARTPGETAEAVTLFEASP